AFTPNCKLGNNCALAPRIVDANRKAVIKNFFIVLYNLTIHTTKFEPKLSLRYVESRYWFVQSMSSYAAMASSSCFRFASVQFFALPSRFLPACFTRSHFSTDEGSLM